MASLLGDDLMPMDPNVKQETLMGVQHPQLILSHIPRQLVTQKGNMKKKKEEKEVKVEKTTTPGG
jgi:hypothetical protein